MLPPEVVVARKADFEEREGGVVLVAPRFGPGLLDRIQRRIFGDRKIRIRLDEMGTFVWLLCDGATCLKDIIAALEARFGKGLEGARVLLVGLAYKKNVDDIRESPGFVIVEHLQERGANVDYYDPYVPEMPLTREHPQLAGRRSVPWTAESIAGYDAAVICTDHDEVDYGLLVEHARLIVDSRNVIRRKGLESEKLLLA